MRASVRAIKKENFANSKKSVHKERPIKTELINNLVMNG